MKDGKYDINTWGCEILNFKFVDEKGIRWDISKQLLL